MKSKIKDRKIVIVNQAVNYLTIGIANAFAEQFEEVHLITGNVHTQGEELSSQVTVTKIARYKEASTKEKFISFLKAIFQIGWLLLTKYRKYEVFFVSVPPFGYLTMLLLRNRFSVLIWDVYPDAFKIYNMSDRHPAFRFWKFANKKLFKRAYRLFTIGDKMADLISKYVPRERLCIVPLWTCFEAFEKVPRSENKFVELHELGNKFIVQYSGNVGITHNVEVLVEVARLLKSDEQIAFMIIGKGERVQKIKQMVANYQLDNFKVLPFQSDEMFPFSLSAADMGVVVLDDQISKGSVPSKTYNLMASSMPILYISAADSELAVYAEKYKNGSCFNSNDIEQIAAYIHKLSRDQQLMQTLKNHSLQASANFTRRNADQLVAQYIG
ncbi:MAG: hypothetical protein RLY16_2450 [Bacteroidota bacterium]|jgi:glycosyltransferase involved in cell wall biosynthesis